MKCPHCQVAFHENPQTFQLGSDLEAFWHLETQTCPSCNRLVMQLVSNAKMHITDQHVAPGRELSRQFVRPRSATRPAPSINVPDKFRADYVEAALVLADSPQASAALSRRCLQRILREVAKVKHGNLAGEIDQVLGSGQLPSHLAEAIDAVRNIGNFAAHPIKSTNSGEVLPVEPGEAEWTLDVLDGVFDFYFDQPALLKQRRDALNKKLAEAGKPAVKG